MSATVTPIAGSTAPAAPEEPVVKFEFDDAFQSSIAALTVRSTPFMQRTDGLLKPEYFTNESEGLLVGLALDYYAKYKRVPADRNIYGQIIRDALMGKRLRKEQVVALVPTVERLWKTDVSDANFVIDQVATFARHQAVAQAMAESIPKLDVRDFAFIQKKLSAALNVGASPETMIYDFKKNIDSRTANRKEIAAGKTPPQGITTGFPAIDKHLYHRGWGRRELSVLMGGAKAGKTLALMEFGLAACAKGHTVLYVTLEVGKEVLSARADANISQVPFSDLNSHIIDVMDKVRAWNAKAGDFILCEYPSGSMTVSDLSRLVEHLKAQGKLPDLVIVDYADIMAPERYTESITENSKSVYVGLRGFAMREGVAVLTATQTNREGFKANVAKAEHIAEDFNKVRIADVILSLNATEEEIKAGEARIYFAVCRNQAAGFSIRVKQDRGRMKFITGIVGEE